MFLFPLSTPLLALIERFAASECARWTSNCDSGWVRTGFRVDGCGHCVARAEDRRLSAEHSDGHSTPAVGISCGGTKRIQCVYWVGEKSGWTVCSDTKINKGMGVYLRQYFKRMPRGQKTIIERFFFNSLHNALTRSGIY